LNAPKNLRVSENTVTQTSFMLIWDAVSKADSYTVSLFLLAF